MSLVLTLPGTDTPIQISCHRGEPGDTLTLTNLILKHTPDTAHSSVQIFMAKLDGGTYLGNLEVIVKIAHKDRDIELLREEADFYVDKLRDFGGTFVPKFYGYYQDEQYGCTVLQYCGEPAVDHLSKLTLHGGNNDFRNTLIEGIWTLHLNEIVHNALHLPHHILKLNGKPFIVDFCLADSDVSCPATYRRLNWDTKKLLKTEGELKPKSFLCREISEFLKSLKAFWLPNTIDWFGVIIHCYEIDSPGYLYERGANQLHQDLYSDDEFWELAVTEWNNGILPNWKKYHPEQQDAPTNVTVDLDTYVKNGERGRKVFY
ncbi:hypothetical protein H0H87_001150 [Tephrocybe sp. NHM501043]|nr:hypothetical protein H0H87_001150 [Tephrocybe sp. NHM501043]